MGLILGLGVLLLFLAVCVAGIIFAVKRWGLRRVCVYASYGIAARLLLGAISADDIGEKFPRIAAGVVLLLWPHMLEHRAKEKEAIRQREDTSAQDDSEYRAR